MPSDALDWCFEQRLWQAGISPVAGVDEAGRGALAGPIVAAAVILPFGRHPFSDSKQVSPQQREELAHQVRETALAWSVARVEAHEIDELGVLAATHRASLRAIGALNIQPRGLITDYLALEGGWRVAAPPRADQRSLQAAAASLLAKTTRDEIMRNEFAVAYPEYGFAQHKGYGVPAHLEALDVHGPCLAHRLRFAPVAQASLFPKSSEVGVT